MTEGWYLPPPVLRQCQICLHRSADVTSSMVRWRDPLPGAEYQEQMRCRDHTACRQRVEDFGDLWPVDDHTPATLRARGHGEPPATVTVTGVEPAPAPAADMAWEL